MPDSRSAGRLRPGSRERGSVSPIRVFARRTHWTPTDSLAFYGPPPMFMEHDRTWPVHVNVTFTWDLPHGEHLAQQWRQFYDDVRIGGPAIRTPVGEFTPGMYLKEGCTITSRGCPKDCYWCGVRQQRARDSDAYRADRHSIVSG